MSTPEHEAREALLILETMETIPSGVQHRAVPKPPKASDPHPRSKESPSEATLQIFGTSSDRERLKELVGPTHYAFLEKQAHEWESRQRFIPREDLEKWLAVHGDSRQKRSSAMFTTQSSSDDPVHEKKRAKKCHHRGPTSSTKSGEPQMCRTPASTTFTDNTLSIQKEIQDGSLSDAFRTSSGPSILHVARYLKRQAKEPKPSKRRGRYEYEPPGRSPLRNAVETEAHPNSINNQSYIADCEAAHPSLDEYDRIRRGNQGRQIERGKSLGIITHSKPLQYSNLAKLV